MKMKRLLITALVVLALGVWGLYLNRVVAGEFVNNEEGYISWVSEPGDTTSLFSSNGMYSRVTFYVQEFIDESPGQPVEIEFRLPDNKVIVLNLRKFLKTQDIRLSIYEKPSVLFIDAPGEYVGIGGKDEANPNQALHIGD